MINRDNDVDIARRFRHFRKKHIGSQYDAAKLLGVSQKRISEVENGKCGMGFDLVRALVKRKHMNSQWLITGIGDDVSNLENKRTLVHDLSDIKADIETLFTLMDQHNMKLKLIASALGTNGRRVGDK